MVVDGGAHSQMANGDGVADDMYCFRCRDREKELVTELWAHVDIPWAEFSAKLLRTFGRAVEIVYHREGESQERRVQTGEDFDDMCEYVDDAQASGLVFECLHASFLQGVYPDFHENVMHDVCGSRVVIYLFCIVCRSRF
jgi:hypothetical protein